MLAVGGNLAVKPVTHLLMSHLDQTRSYCGFFSISERESRNDVEEAVQWHMGCAQILALASPIPLWTRVAGSQHANSSGGSADNSKQLPKGNLRGYFWLPSPC